MRYEIQHTTIYRYSEHVHESVMELRMKPRSEGSQNCLSFRVETSPAAKVFSYVDGWDNQVHYFDIPTPHLQLEIRVVALVEVADREEERTLPKAPPGTTATDGLARVDSLPWLLPSHYAHSTLQLEKLMTELGLFQELPPLEALQALCSGLRQTFTYEKNVTRVDSGIDESLTTRRGVCQDFAHIFIAAARRLGVPCRYVSGYLCESVKGASAEANHAWAEAWIPGPGWLGFDPTNDSRVGAGHVRVAVGRDYRDVPPSRGTCRGNASSDLEVRIEIRSI